CSGRGTSLFPEQFLPAGRTVVLDLALHSDLHPLVRHLKGVTVLGLADLAMGGAASEDPALAEAEQIVRATVEAFHQQQEVRRIDPRWPRCAARSPIRPTRRSTGCGATSTGGPRSCLSAASAASWPRSCTIPPSAPATWPRRASPTPTSRPSTPSSGSTSPPVPAPAADLRKADPWRVNLRMAPPRRARRWRGRRRRAPPRPAGCGWTARS